MRLLPLPPLVAMQLLLGLRMDALDVRREVETLLLDSEVRGVAAAAVVVVLDSYPESWRFILYAVGGRESGACSGLTTTPTPVPELVSPRIFRGLLFRGGDAGATMSASLKLWYVVSDVATLRLLSMAVRVPWESPMQRGGSATPYYIQYQLRRLKRKNRQDFYLQTRSAE